MAARVYGLSPRWKNMTSTVSAMRKDLFSDANKVASNSRRENAAVLSFVLKGDNASSKTTSASSKLSPWTEIRMLRARDDLQIQLHGCFDNDAFERRIIKKNKHILRFLTVWSTYNFQNGLELEFSEKGMPTVSDEGLKTELSMMVEAVDDPELSFLFKRVLSGDPLSRGPAHFPERLLMKGPQYPFQPGDFHQLQKRLGSLRGHELTTRLKLKQSPPDAGDLAERRPAGRWEDQIYDDDDLISDRRRPYL